MKINFVKFTKDFVKSVWLFPAILTLLLIILSALQINGSSIGIYHKIFYGDAPDKSLIRNQPLTIRSDEWIVNTQKTIAQKNNDFKTINKNQGNGEDTTFLADTPYKNWSTVFKPHNLGFLFLPFDNAFALKWWMLSYLLILSCYFFVLALMPKKKLLAILISLGLLFSPFFQWWYMHGTLGSIYYCLFAMAILVRLFSSKNLRQSVFWGALLAYIGVGFALILYPPFQIPCAIVVVGFFIGYVLDNKILDNKKRLKRNILVLLGVIIIIISTLGLALFQKQNIIKTIQHTEYPGQRVVKSGGYEFSHLLSGNLDETLQYPSKAAFYSMPNINVTNQSESSSFILLIPFLIIPALALILARIWPKNYTIIILSGVFLFYIAWLLVPGLDIIGKAVLLDKVPHQRLIIGIGLLNIVFLITFIQQYARSKDKIPIKSVTIYSVMVFMLLLVLDLYVMNRFPGFIGYKRAIVLAIPTAVIIFCLLRKYFVSAAILYLVFNLFSTCKVNPLYIGTEILSNTRVSQDIKEVSANSNKKWISEEIYLENFATMNGKPSLTGTYLYPQLDLWSGFERPEEEKIYNRYAHVSFTFDRDPNKDIKPVFTKVGEDQFNIKLEPCDDFFKKNNVGYLITTVEFKKNAAKCTSLLKKVEYPNISYYIYRVAF